MKTRQYLESFVKKGYNGHASMFYSVEEFQFKFTYEHGNSYERFKIEVFDGTALNFVAGMYDLNEERKDAYHKDETWMKNRYVGLCVKARKYVETLIKNKM